MVKLGQPWWLCLLASAVVTGLAGFLIAFPCLRVATDFLSLITIAFNSVFQTVCLTWVTVTDGPIGIIGVPAPQIAGFVFNTPIRYYYLFLTMAVLTYVALRNILYSRVGRAMISIRDDEICAAAQGINVRYYKVLAFVLGTIPAGIAGCLSAGYLRYVSPIPFSFNQSLKIMNMVILGGLGSLPGSVLGAIFFVAVPEIFRPLAVYEVGIGGIIMILLMFFRPQGILGSAAYAGEGGLQGIIGRWRQRALERRKGNPIRPRSIDGTPSTG
jgi:branched-chain amino acid transport system permease protein